MRELANGSLLVQVLVLGAILIASSCTVSAVDVPKEAEPTKIEDNKPLEPTCIEILTRWYLIVSHVGAKSY